MPARSTRTSVRRATVAVTAALAILVAPAAWAAPTIRFDPVVEYDAALWTGSGSGSIATADFNVDGHPDLVVVDAPSRSVSVVLNNGNGMFSRPYRTVSSLLDTYAVAAGDFNGDGLPDVAAASDLGSLTLGLVPDLTILLGNGDGTFRKAYGYRSGVLPQQIAVADFDVDGRLDLGVVGGAGDVKVLRGNGNGSFQAGPTVRVGGGTTSIAAADLNGDGHPDLAVSGGSGLTQGKVWVLPWNPSGGNVSAAVGYTVAAIPEQVAAADVNHDGRADLVTANAGAAEISVLINGANGFAPYQGFRVGGGGAGVAIADFDGDGNPDVAIGRSVANRLSILTGTGTGTFVLAADYSVPGGPQAMAVEDFDGDGRLDIGAAISSPGLAVLRNASG